MEHLFACFVVKTFLTWTFNILKLYFPACNRLACQSISKSINSLHRNDQSYMAKRISLPIVVDCLGYLWVCLCWASSRSFIIVRCAWDAPYAFEKQESNDEMPSHQPKISCRAYKSIQLMKRNIIKTKHILYIRTSTQRTLYSNRPLNWGACHTMEILLFVMHKIHNDEHRKRRIAFIWETKISSTIRFSFILTLSKTKSVCSALYLHFSFSTLGGKLLWAQNVDMLSE